MLLFKAILAGYCRDWEDYVVHRLACWYVLRQAANSLER